MSIQIKNEKRDEKTGKLVSFDLSFDNGDVAKHNDIMEHWNFSSAEKLYRFAMSVLQLSNATRIIGTKDESGVLLERTPREDLLNNE